MDGFHLSRACGRGYGAEIGPAIYNAIRSGSESFASALMSAAVAAETKTAIRDREYIESNLVNAMDWRNRVPNAPPGRSRSGNDGIERRQAHGEPDEEAGHELDHTRGESNGQDDPAESKQRVVEVLSQATGTGEAESASARPIDGHNACQRLGQASVPALTGPHNSRPWATGLRRLLRTAY